ncbi:MAG: iron-sulfur cluster insertion protein ErpA [Endozoicomonadaceae bacterium]|nr:iron-sulfur cluster insertion protein ErpA [Endozoicomonadaceae bacterium]MCY4329293.1 iron-sulfur cluster insertion protein ErpA [Endozoicomonadaceae bacterium]
MSGHSTFGAEEFVPALLVLTKNAITKIKDLMKQESNDLLMLRVFITGGGCSGFQYGFSFDDQCNSDDTVIESDGVKLVVDPMSLQYLTGSEVDYEQGLAGSRFIVNNPNATTTCGCGASFSV